MTIALLARAAAKAIIRCDDARSELHAAARVAARPAELAAFDFAALDALLKAAHVFRRAEDRHIRIGLGLVRARRRDYERSVAEKPALSLVGLDPLVSS